MEQQLQNTDSLLSEANLYRMRRQFTDATDNCVKVLRAEPGNVTAHSLLGDIYRDQNQLEEAVHWYRMAVDLKPSASEETKLRETENALSKQLAQSQSHGRNSSDDGFDSEAGGTRPLMGYTPRRWLTAITVVSVAFLSVTVLALVLMHGGRNGTDMPRTLSLGNPELSPINQNGSALPPVRHGGRTVLPAGENPQNPVSTPPAAGSGLAPDQRGAPQSAGAPPVKPPDPVLPSGIPKAGESSSNSSVPAAIPPAPIRSVRPITKASSGLIPSGEETPSTQNSAAKTDESSTQNKDSQPDNEPNKTDSNQQSTDPPH